jgi:hypothetical protein
MHWKGRVIMGVREGVIVGAEVGAEAGAQAVEDQGEVGVWVIGAVGVGAEEEASVRAIGHHLTQALDTFLAAHPAPCHGPPHVPAVAVDHLITWTQNHRVDILEQCWRTNARLLSDST